MKIKPDETAASFASRFPGAVESGLLEGIHAGSSQAIVRLARVSATPAEALAKHFFKPGGANNIKMGDETFGRSGLLRTHARACPCCLKDDLKGGAQEIHGRASWVIQSVRSCADHKVALVTPPDGGVMKNFNGSWKPHLGAIETGELISRVAADTPFENYTQKRLRSGAGDEWHDRYQIDVLGKMSEIIGISRLFGKAALYKDVSENDICEALSVGFGIISNGPEAVISFFDDLRHSKGDHRDAPQARYGEIYDWMRRGPGSKSSFDGFREIFRKHILDSWPLDKGDVALDVVVDERRFHTLFSASEEYGIHHVRLRKILEGTGHFSKDDLGPDRIISVEALNRIVEVEQGAMTYPEVHKYLDIGRSQLEALVAGDVLIPTPPQKGTRPRFPKSTIENFRAMIEALPEVEDESKDTLQKASQRLKCGAVKAINALLSGELPSASRLPGDPLYSSIHVDLEDLRSAISKGSPEPGSD